MPWARTGTIGKERAYVRADDSLARCRSRMESAAASADRPDDPGNVTAGTVMERLRGMRVVSQEK
ncbi:hypothetical protein AB0R12_24955 [Streptomyces niveus]|uniref:hypothetical protein n=1 Tax=Streptomyces niveus TaxID=193462 RepID=UPI00342C772E